MRPLLALWLSHHGLPAWLAPTYFSLAVLSALVGCLVALRLAEAAQEDLGHEARALALAYLGAMFGGYALEALRALPEAVITGSLTPCLRVGRAAYGGLLFSIVLAVSYRIKHQLSVAAFLDRTMIGAGVAILGVRIGCFLSGCDYGIPTASWLGVRFPAGSLAALDHAARGFVPLGSPSLPVHPTELYEALLGAGAMLIAAPFLSSRYRAGTAFLTWLALYAGGRFFNEFLRGDASRGLYLGLSSAQYISLMVCTLVAVLLTLRLFQRGGALPFGTPSAGVH
jgi:prolipoprotein diacylglyceryltransferase